MFSKYGTAIIAGTLVIDITAIGGIAIIVDGATGIVHTASTASCRASISVAAATASAIITIIITIIDASLFPAAADVAVRRESLLISGDVIERRSAPAGNSEPVGAR